MNIQDIISSAISLSEKYASPRSAKLRQLQALPQSDKMKVVVLGDFKAGKSTLINRLFIRKDMLPTDYLEATSVPTHLSNGSMGMTTWMLSPEGEDVLVNERIAFSAEEVAATVTATSEEGRADKAARYSKVCITMPGILPDHITLVDTPGLNTPNTGIYTGTLAEAHTADAILYLVRGRQLSARDKDIILDIAGGQATKVPVHVVLTHSAEDNIAQNQLQSICEAIRADLRSLQCGVSTFSLSNTDGSAEVLTGKIKAAFDGFGFFNTEDTHTDAPAASGNLEAELLEFFNGKVRFGRMARLARELRPELIALTSAVNARLTLAGAKESELKELEAKKNEVQTEYLRVVKSILLDVRTVQQDFRNNVDSDMIQIQDEFIDKLNKQDSTAGILTCIGYWQQDIPSKLQLVLAKRRLNLEQDIMSVCEKHQQAFIEKLTPTDVNTELKKDWLISFATFMPNWALLLADFIIFDIISPLPSVMDGLVRMLASYIPVVRDMMPANIAANLARKAAISKLRDCIKDIQDQVAKQLDSKFSELNDKLEKQLKEADVISDLNAAMAELRSGILSIQQKKLIMEDAELVAQWGLSI